MKINFKPTQVITATGNLDLLDPAPGDIHITDIAVHHAGTKRFNAARDVRIAEHVTAGLVILKHTYAGLCCKYRWLELAWILHDAHEAYTGDITRPMEKAILKFTKCDHVIHAIKSNIQNAVHERFVLPWPLPQDAQKAIAHTDDQILNTEFRDCSAGDTWQHLPPPWPTRLIDPLDEQQALTAFLEAFTNACDTAGVADVGWVEVLPYAP